MISINKATVKDINDILSTKISAFKEDKDLYGFGPKNYDSRESTMRAIKSGDYYKIMYDNKIVGGMCIYDKGEGNYYISSIYIEQKYQNKGIGTAAMQFLDDKYPKSLKWSLQTPYLSYRNHHFYEKMGFFKIGETKPDLDNNNFYLFLYERIC